MSEHERNTPGASIERTEHIDSHSDMESGLAGPALELTIHLHAKPIALSFEDKDATLQDLSDTVAEELSIPPAHQKFMITPKTGLLKPPFKDPTLALSTLHDKKIVLMGATTTEVAELDSDIAARKERMQRRRAALQAGRKTTASTMSKSRDWSKVQDEAKYTFHSIRPLQHLPRSEKSQRFLEKLRDDAGIKACMRKHQFSVGLLTEMDPAEHTTHESRTLGLNRNRGEVIELRLRTDAYDGYRDYKVIRKTLCHELTHNVWGDHDRNFWNLCKEIEKEVDRADWRSGGKSVGAEEFANPADDGLDLDDEHMDGGGWTGGEFVLGGRGDANGLGGGRALSRREIIAQAAEDRMKREKEAKDKQRAGDAGAAER